MKLFKFVGGNPFPDVYYFSETMAFGHSSDYEIIYRAHLIEDLGLHSIGGSIYTYLLTEALGLLDRIGLTEFLEEVLGLSDLEERWGWGYFDEILNLQDTTSQRMVYSITLNEGLGFVESGSYNLALVDYRVTWRARTRIPGIGYGKAGYGIEYDYGAARRAIYLIEEMLPWPLDRRCACGGDLTREFKCCGRSIELDDHDKLLSRHYVVYCPDCGDSLAGACCEACGRNYTWKLGTVESHGREKRTADGRIEHLGGEPVLQGPLAGRQARHRGGAVLRRDGEGGPAPTLYAVFYNVFWVTYMDFAKFFASLDEVFGVQMSWRKLERLGRI